MPVQMSKKIHVSWVCNTAADDKVVWLFVWCMLMMTATTTTMTMSWYQLLLRAAKDKVKLIFLKQEAIATTAKSVVMLEKIVECGTGLRIGNAISLSKDQLVFYLVLLIAIVLQLARSWCMKVLQKSKGHNLKRHHAVLWLFNVATLWK